MIHKQTLINAIYSFGLQNAAVCIHTSMRSFGDEIEGGADGLAETFLESGCTVLVPTFSDIYEEKPVPGLMPPQNGAGDYSFFLSQTCDPAQIFTPASNAITVEEMGLFPYYMLHRADRQRGNHPLNSFAAVGREAERLIAQQNARDVYAPLEALCASGGYVLLMGTGLESATILHYAEQCAGRTPLIRWANDRAGNVMPVSAGSCSDGFEKLRPYLAEEEKCVTVGESLWRCYRAAQMVEICARIIRENPQITHCSDPSCSRCNDAILGGPQLSPSFWDGK